MTILTALLPAIVKIIMMLLGGIGVSRENKRKFLQNVLNNSSDEIASKLREEYNQLLKDNSKKDDDVF